MLVRLTDKTLEKIDDDLEFNGRLGHNLANAFRTLMLHIRSVDNENDLRAMKSLHFEKLKGKRQHEYSMRLDRQFRLIFQIEKAGPHNQLVVTGIEDYH
jgi:toxin HigB-1